MLPEATAWAAARLGRRPYGEYYLRPGKILGRAALLIVPAILIVWWFAASLDLDSSMLRLLVTGLIGGALAPPCIAGLSLVGGLRGGPPLKITEEGIELTRGFLWTLIPFLPVPETRNVIPWADIQAIEPLRGMETAVLIQRRGDRKRWWERIGVSAKRPAGRVVDLSFFKGNPEDLGRSLLAWSEARLRLEVNRARVESFGPIDGAGSEGPQPSTHSFSGNAVDQASFYDDIAEYYDLIYSDWAGSMQRHGAAISAMLGRPPAGTRILDVSAGIGTQTLPLAAMGYEVVARDLSPAAIRRLQREAQERGLVIDAASSDMRDVGASVEGLFDAVISFDNSIPHLLTDPEIIATLQGFRNILAPGGVLLLSIRDYEGVDRSSTSIHRYGERTRRGSQYRMSQEWEWYDASHYRTTMIVERAQEQEWTEVVRTVAAYYAIPIPRLLELMRGVGFQSDRVDDPPFFQPVLRGRAV